MCWPCLDDQRDSSVEFIEHVLEKELSKVETSASDEEIVKKLQGLGYLD